MTEKVPKTVVCVTCGREIEKKQALKVGDDFICKNDDGLCVKPSIADKAKALVSKVQTAKEAKTAKKKAKAAPKPKLNIYYKVLPYQAQVGEKIPPRQVQVILSTIQRHAAEDGFILKADLLKALEEANGKATELVETFTHDLQARQPALAILMHYQKRMVDEGRVEMVKK